MPVNAANVSSGLGSGQAQVFEPYKSQYGEEIAKIKGAQQKQKQERESDVYKELGKISTAGIFAPHQEVFAKKQQELYDQTKQDIDLLRKGDPQATIRFQQALSKLGYDIGQSKNVRQSYEKAASDYVSNPDKYRPESGDYLHSISEDINQTYDPKTGLFKEVDPSQIKQTFDLNKYTRENVAPLLKDKIVKGQTATPLGGGRVSTVETEKLPETIKKNEAYRAITDPHVYEEIHYQLKKQNPKSEPTKDDIANYYYENHLKDLFPDITKKHLTEGFAPKEGGQAGNYTVEPIAKTVTLNDPILDENKQPVLDEQGNPTYAPKETDVKSWELKSNVLIEKETSEVYNPKTFQKESPTGSQKFTMSSVVEHTIDKKTGQPVMIYDQKTIDKHPELYEKKKFASGILGTGKDAHPVYIPLEVVKPTLKEKKITLSGIDAPTKNYTIKGKAYTHSQLNDMGYTDEQIEKARKAGTIK